MPKIQPLRLRLPPAIDSGLSYSQARVRIGHGLFCEPRRDAAAHRIGAEVVVGQALENFAHSQWACPSLAEIEGAPCVRPYGFQRVLLALALT